VGIGRKDALFVGLNKEKRIQKKFMQWQQKGSEGIALLC
jgi:hypothetical protein